MPASGIDTSRLRQILTTPGAAAPDLKDIKKPATSTTDALDLASPLKALGNKGEGGSTTAPRASLLSKLPGLASKAGGLGAMAMAGAGALGSILPSGSGAQGVAKALTPLSDDPKANAAGNLAETAMPSVSSGLQRLDSKAQTNQMEGIGDGMQDKTKTSSMNLAHDAGEDAIDQTKMAANNIMLGVAQNNVFSRLKSIKENAGLVAATVKANAEVAKNGAQTLGS
jgi:hypothetical protein